MAKDEANNVLDDEAKNAAKNFWSVVLSAACLLSGLLCYVALELGSTCYILSYTLLGLVLILMMAAVVSCIRTIIITSKAIKRSNHLKNDLAIIISGLIIVFVIIFFF